jgi:DNA-binding transcriptional LysR family regulator
MNSLEIQQSLLDLKIDVGISHTRPDNTQFLSVPLYEDEFMLCCHKSLLKTFNGKLPVTTKQAMSKFISAVPALSYGHESRLLVDWLSKHRIDKNLLKTSVICENWNTLTQCLLNSVGFGIFPKSFIIKLPNEIIRETIPHRILAPLKFHMIFRRAYRYNPAILELKTALMGAK